MRRLGMLLLVGLLGCQGVGTGAEGRVGRELVAATQQLLDAVGRGDASVWEKYLSSDFTVTDEEGNTLDRSQFLAQLRPLPAGYSGALRVTDPKVLVSGEVAVVTHRDLETETVFGQRLEAQYVTTDTWVRRGSRWRLLASHVTVIPAPRPAVAIAPQLLDAYVGRYQLAPGVVYTVTRKGDTLWGQRTGRPEEKLAASGAASFFREGTWRAEKIFVRGPEGRVTEMIDRRDNHDLVWQRLE